MKKIALYLLASLLLFSFSCSKNETIPNSDSNDALQTAWDQYHQTIREVEQEFISSKIYQLDESHQIGAYELLAMFIQSNMHANMANPDYPNFGYMESPSLRIGIDNPDCNYNSTLIWNPDGEHVYRIWGNRGSTADFLIQVLNGADPHGAISILEDKDITINADGSYEVFLCAEKKTGMQNWMELPSGSPLLTLMVRNEHAQWDKEQQGPMQIERVGTSGIANPGTVKDAFIKRINYTREILARQGTFWPKFAWKITTLTKKNSLTKFKTTGDIGIQTQKFSLGYWELEDDEALIVKLTEIDAGYCGFHMANFWGSSPDWQNKFSSMSWGRNGRSQAYKSKDGFYYIVVTKNDPGIQNWIETSGMKKGLLVLRLQGLENPELSYKPETQVVKHSQLRESLPADMPAVTLEQRSELLKMRQQNVLKRYTYW